MPRQQSSTSRSDRIELRASPDEKALIARAASLERLDLTAFVMRSTLPVARAVIADSERIELSERDSLFVMDLLENPPPPTERLRAAARPRPKAV